MVFKSARRSYLHVHFGRFEVTIGGVLRLAQQRGVVVLFFYAQAQHRFRSETIRIGGHRFGGVTNASGDAVAVAIDPGELRRKERIFISGLVLNTEWIFLP